MNRLQAVDSLAVVVQPSPVGANRHDLVQFLSVPRVQINDCALTRKKVGCTVHG
jgi:hypothetical protein